MLALALAVRAQVVINEVLPEDRTVLADEDGDHTGWIELRNAGNEAVDLSGYGLSDDPAQPFRWTFPSLAVAPGDSLLVFTSGKDRRVPADSPATTPDPAPGFTPLELGGLIWWLDSADTNRFVFDDDRIVEWQDKSGRRPQDDVPPALDPAAVAGKILWVDSADELSLTVVDGKVAEWRDKSGRGRDAKQDVPGRRPAYVAAGGGEVAAIRFDGSDDVLAFPPVEVRTVVWVGREIQVQPGSYRPLIGDTTAFDFARGAAGEILGEYPGMAPGALGGRTFLNQVSVTPKTTVLPAGLNVVSFIISGAVRAGNLASDRLIPGRSWWGDLAEVILFDRPLTDAELRGIERHLQTKWNTPSPTLAEHYHAHQSRPELQPRLTLDPLTGFPAVEFDGVDDRLEFWPMNRLRTVFWVVREADDTADSFRPLLGDVGGTDFIRGDDGLLFTSSLSTRLNGQPVDPTITRLPRGRVMVSVTTSGPGRASLLASDRLLADRVWSGGMMEVIAFDRALSVPEREVVEGYLSRKWLLPSHNLHANFRLQEDGEAVQLTRPDRTVADATTVLETRVDVTYGRVPGKAAWAWFDRPTPAAENDAVAYPDGLTPKPRFLPDAALFSGSLEVSFDLTNAPPGTAIWFTTDGSAPDRTGADAVWFDDATPPGAQALALGSQPWVWQNNPTPFFGTAALNSGVSSGLHQLIITAIPTPLVLLPGESLVAYVQLKAGNLPQEVMLQWHSGDSWGHRAYWGANLINSGVDGTPSRLRIGDLPPGEKWFRLEVPAKLVGLEGKSVDGIALTLFGGEASFDQIGKTTFAGQLYSGPLTLTRSTSLRAQARAPGRAPSRVVSAGYLVTPAGGLPVLSITTPKENLFDSQTGIYVHGPTTNPDGSARTPNWDRTWERPAQVEWLEPDGRRGFNVECGVKIHGAYTRALPQKSLRLHFRSRYGAPELNYPVFPGLGVTEFETLIVRNSGNDWNYAYLRDPLGQSLGADLGLPNQAWRPVQVFINGEYWGLHDVRERPDDRYIESHEFVDAARLDVIKNEVEIEAGDSTAYHTFLGRVTSGNFANQAEFDGLVPSLDLENYTDWLILEIYGGNQDWPGNNVLMWRQREDVAPWRWVLIDMDGCFNSVGSGPGLNTLAWVLRDKPFEGLSSRSIAVMRGLMENAGYRVRFVNRFADLLNTTLAEEYVVARLNSLQAQLAPAMPGQIARWGTPTGGHPGLANLPAWEANVEVIREFVRQRPAILRQQLIHFFQLGGLSRVTVGAPPHPGLAAMQVNSLRLEPARLPWSGDYFAGAGVELTAVAAVGYRFAGWSDGIGGLNPTRVWVPSSDLSVTPQFVVDDSFNPDDLVPRPYDLRRGPYEFRGWSGNSTAATYPPAMLFHQSATKDPGLEADMEWVWTGRYDLTSRSRIRGLDDEGVSFINTSDPQNGEGFLGAALVALRTTDRKNIEVSWTGGTVAPNSRPYALRLQWRTGTNGPFADVLGPGGQPVEYRRHAAVGHAESIGPIALPESAANRPVIQLRWRYHSIEGAETGARAELRLDDIEVTSASSLPDPGPFRIAVAMDDGILRVQALVPPRASFTLLTSADLVLWEAVETKVAGPDGRVEFQPPVDDSPARFFQIRSL